MPHLPTRTDAGEASVSEVLVHETCECGTEVPRRIFVADEEPRVSCIEVVWCPNCKREFGG